MLRTAARYLNNRAAKIRIFTAAGGSHLPDHANCIDSRSAHQLSGSSGDEAAGPGPGSQLEDTFMQLYRRHNSSLKHLKGQVIGAKVFKTDRRFVFLDTGFNKYVKYAKKELHLSQLVSSKDGGLRTSPEDFRVGDVLQFFVEELETPYGDMQLAAERRIEKDKVAGVWEMIKEAMRSNKPVMGRVLNGVNGGYSVGVAGIVAFCPFSQMSFLTASKVGMLQPFLVTSMNEVKRNIVLQDVSMLGKRRGPRGDLVSDQGRSPGRAAH